MRNDSKSLNVAAAGIMQAIDAAGSMGAPGGVLYAGLMSKGYSFNEYHQIMVCHRARALLRQIEGAE